MLIRALKNKKLKTQAKLASAQGLAKKTANKSLKKEKKD